MKGPDMTSLISQAQKMKKEMARVQEALKTRVVEGASGGGRVVAQVNGALELVSLKIHPEVIVPEDKEVLEDLVVVAVNQAIQEAQKMVQEEMSKLTGGLRLPGMF